MLTAADIAGITDAFAETLRDTCQIATPSVTKEGPYASTTVSYGADVACGIKYRNDAQDTEGGDGAQAPTDSATIRLPVGTSITPQSRVKVTKRLGTTLPVAQEWAVTGYPMVKLGYVQCQLKAVQAGGVE